MRPIDADELLNDIEDAIDIENDGQDVEKSKHIILGLKIAKKYIKKACTIEAAPVKHGRWILSDDKNWLTCSFCGAEVDVSCGAPFFYVDNDEVSHINFCPNCGCKQDLEGSDING